MAGTRPSERPRVVLVMGVSGSGKTTIGRMLAERLGWDYAEADAFHPRANIEKMSEGIPLGDADRMPWLGDIAEWIEGRDAPGVVSCSALKRAYREMLPPVTLVYLDGSHELIEGRMRSRIGHFFKPAMLDGQFRDLEPPHADEHPVTVSIEGTPEDIIDRILAGLKERGITPA
ncbi:gluconokinase [Actinomadura parmotrematis]|uniref:Gluconokinase n=1 Tax=Actinomadura parmotrematis TaxID=2864039 RepID=A0ABS7FTZ4_9ACTN|nr:gluconokinase [Actinomadura parmotrematis]MBW8483847.1 gluconokinase [Actinomadura parmotrematis]